MSTKINKKKILYIDMDQVIVDFEGSPRLKDWEFEDINPPAMYEPGFFEALKPLPGALAAIRVLINSDKFDIWILTKPVARSPHSYSEKVCWIYKYIPELGDKMILTQNKELHIGDFLIDDDRTWNKFDGEFIHFNKKKSSFQMWKEIVDRLLDS